MAQSSPRREVLNRLIDCWNSGQMDMEGNTQRRNAEAQRISSQKTRRQSSAFGRRSLASR